MRTSAKAAGGAYHAIISMQHCSCTLLMAGSSNNELTMKVKEQHSCSYAGGERGV